ncbi:hypothetical protein EVAR_38842_1 [Eumeta japonica]|uniref:Ig-like domain-containing protein n=1 Tax=Eumeta variegata TaxID=151549 RepID=A0A4C1XR29_EUMVA|nr:hypothetical protein EVAR_38842_1 [Eumeta japonica]
MGRKATLPCDIQPLEMGDQVSMVLWFKESDGEPLYSCTPVATCEAPAAINKPVHRNSVHHCAHTLQESVVRGDREENPKCRFTRGYDVRGRLASHPKLWSSPNGFGSRAFFRASAAPAALLVDNVLAADAGLYRCRVDFKNSPTRNLRLNFTVIKMSNGISFISISKSDEKKKWWSDRANKKKQFSSKNCVYLPSRWMTGPVSKCSRRVAAQVAPPPARRQEDDLKIPVIRRGAPRSAAARPPAAQS